MFIKKIYTIQSVLFALLFYAYGCATPIQPKELKSSYNLPYQLSEIEGSYWWRIQFLMPWPNDGEVEWPVDLLLAHAVVSPVLVNHSNKITYWRFHRRAARDTAGHKFSFIFYSDPTNAKTIFDEINQNMILKELLNMKIVKKILTDNTQNPKSPHIADTSDPHWSVEIQNSWPPYIMGVSSLWLGLIAEEMKDSPKSYSDFNALLNEYRRANEAISEKWRKEGQHAFIHHLSAIFGYHPLLIKKNIQF